MIDWKVSDSAEDLQSVKHDQGFNVSRVDFLEPVRPSQMLDELLIPLRGVHPGSKMLEGKTRSLAFEAQKSHILHFDVPGY